MRALVVALLASIALAAPAARALGDPEDRDDAVTWPAPLAHGDGWSQVDVERFRALCGTYGTEPFCACWLEAVEPRYRTLLAFLRDLGRTRSGGLDLEFDRCWGRHGAGR